MPQGNTRIGHWTAGLALAALACAGNAWAGQVRSLTLEQGAASTRAEVELQGAGQYRTLSLAGPDRLVLDLPESEAARGLTLPRPAGVVTAVRTGQPVPGTLRIVFELSAPATARPLRVERSADGARLFIEWPGTGPGPAAVAAASPTPTPALPTAAPVQETVDAPVSDPHADAARATALLAARTTQALQATSPATSTAPAAASTPGQPASTRSPLEILEGRAPADATPASNGAAQSASVVAPAVIPPPAPVATPPLPMSTKPLPKGARVLIVAIDAGHGGQDPGAIGPTGKREKDVNLAMAREMARQINTTPGLKAFLVRDADVFIPLQMRAQIARKAKADIFVSLHADAAENRSARGSSVYVLSTKGASSQRARWLADKENAADLVGGVRLQQTENVLAGVLLDLAQSGHMRASEDAANNVLGGLKRVGNNHKPSIERANFAVLRTSDMPAMLVETAFISNAEEERRLVDPAYQRKVAAAVVDGISTYFTRQPPPGTLFAMRAETESLAIVGGTP